MMFFHRHKGDLGEIQEGAKRAMVLWEGCKKQDKKSVGASCAKRIGKRESLWSEEVSVIDDICALQAQRGHLMGG